jgi:hypothetical protein
MCEFYLQVIPLLRESSQHFGLTRNVNPSSRLKVTVHRKSRLGVTALLRNPMIGQISSRISELVTVIERM